MTDMARISRVALAVGLAASLTACMSMNEPLSKSSAVAVKHNMQAQIVPIDPATIPTGPTPTSGERAAVARDNYNTGKASETVTDSESEFGG